MPQSRRRGVTLWGFLLTITILTFFIVFYLVGAKIIMNSTDPLRAELKKEIWQTFNGILDAGPLENPAWLLYSPEERFGRLKSQLAERHDWSQKYNDPSEQVRVEHLIYATKYLRDAWRWTENENFFDAERYLKAAKDHLQKAREISQLQEGRENEHAAEKK